MMNQWQSCKKNPPPNYTRVEIKTKSRQRYVGYRCNNTYYETIGNYIIPDPIKWRYIPQGSALFHEIEEKIHRIPKLSEAILSKGGNEYGGDLRSL